MGRGDIDIIQVADIITVPLVFSCTLIISFIIAHLCYKEDKFLKKHFILGFVFKVIGVIAYSLVFQYYFGWGDTFVYYQVSKDVSLKLIDDPFMFFEILFTPISNYSQETYLFLDNHIGGWILLKQSSASYVVKFSSIASIFGLGSYIGTSIVISMFSYLGIWAAFITFYRKYTDIKIPLSIAWIYLPSMIFWSSTITKEPFSIAGLGFATWSIHNIFIKRRKFFFSIILLYIGAKMTYSIKSYIIISLAIFAVVWIVMTKRERLKNDTLKKLSLPFFLAVGVISIIGFISLAGSILEKYALDSVLQEMETTANWISGVTERTGGSGYDLGNISYTPLGMLTAFPKAVFVTFYRPFLWESRKVMVLVSALESLITLFITLYVILKIGFFKSVSRIVSNSDILFTLGFSILFAFFVGMSSFNFGALARYKIPCLPFYFTALSILYTKEDKKITQ